MRTITIKANGKYGILRTGSSCVYGDFDTYAEAMTAIDAANTADSYCPE